MATNGIAAVPEPANNAEHVAHSAVVLLAFEARCVKCHGKDGKIEGEVDLLAVKDLSSLLARPKLLASLVDAVDSGAMPPEVEPALPTADREKLAAALKRLLAAAASALPASAATPIRRLNRFQFNNAVQDLLDLRVEVFPLPERLMRDLNGYFQPASGKMPPSVKVASRPLSKDHVTEPHLGGATPFPQDLRAEHGFDNRGDHLTLSPMLLESLVRLSRTIVESPDFNEETCGIWNEFFTRPETSAGQSLDVAIRGRLRPFLTRAFRRPLDDELVERYAEFVLSQLTKGEQFEDAMKSVAAAAMSSPRFLYQYDLSRSDAGQPLDGFDLASRLALFLWGGIPDETLHELAKYGKLQNPDVLRGQVERMLRDKRLRRFCDSFPSQWLQLERIISSEPDPEIYPQFYFAKYRASMHMMLEPLLLFETVLIENRSILQLIDSDFSYRSDLLDAWYRDGSQGSAGPPTQVVLKRVPIVDRRQGGVVTTAAVMTMTSAATRTKPVTRGAWLATVIFNDPPPPPPGNVPPLADQPTADEARLTLRERFAAHRHSPACAGCHRRIDPLGFALENFDCAGIWRDKYQDGRPIDASGKLFAKYEFHDVVGFKDALLAEKDRFTRALAGHLLSYALGRQISHADAPSLDKIVRETAAGDYRFQELIVQVVLSDSFRK